MNERDESLLSSSFANYGNLPIDILDIYPYTLHLVLAWLLATFWLRM